MVNYNYENKVFVFLDVLSSESVYGRDFILLMKRKDFLTILAFVFILIQNFYLLSNPN